MKQQTHYQVTEAQMSDMISCRSKGRLAVFCSGTEQQSGQIPSRLCHSVWPQSATNHIPHMSFGHWLCFDVDVKHWHSGWEKTLQFFLVMGRQPNETVVVMYSSELCKLQAAPRSGALMTDLCFCSHTTISHSNTRSAISINTNMTPVLTSFTHLIHGFYPAFTLCNYSYTYTPTSGKIMSNS